jgi:hypothetical protein
LRHTKPITPLGCAARQHRHAAGSSTLSARSRCRRSRSTAYVGCGSSARCRRSRSSRHADRSDDRQTHPSLGRSPRPHRFAIYVERLADDQRPLPLRRCRIWSSARAVVVDGMSASGLIRSLSRAAAIVFSAIGANAARSYVVQRKCGCRLASSMLSRPSQPPTSQTVSILREVKPLGEDLCSHSRYTPTSRARTARGQPGRCTARR